MRCNPPAALLRLDERRAGLTVRVANLGASAPAEGEGMGRVQWTVVVLGALSMGCGSSGGGTSGTMSPAEIGDAGDTGSTTGSAGNDATNGASDSTTGVSDNGGNSMDGTTGAAAADGGATGTVPMGEDPGAAAGVVTCGDTACNTPDVCCVSFLGGNNGGFECKAEMECSGGFSAPGKCDGKEDCGASEVCCAKFALTGGSGAFCEAACASDAVSLCHSDADCNMGESCIPCAPPTGGIVNVVYHLCSATPECPSPYMNAM